MKIKYENLTPFGLWMAHKFERLARWWPLVWKSSYQRRTMELINLEHSYHNLGSELHRMYEKESERFLLPNVCLSETVLYDPPSVKLTIDMKPFNFVVDNRKMFDYTSDMKAAIIEDMSQRFAKELAERFVNAVQSK